MAVEPTTVYRCPECRRVSTDILVCLNHEPDNPGFTGIRMEPVRVFFEEDVRPLWDALHAIERGGRETTSGHDRSAALERGIAVLKTLDLPDTTDHDRDVQPRPPGDDLIVAAVDDQC